MVRFLLVLLAAKMTFASAESIDSECRIQAKETAITAYQSCVKESRTQKIDEIRKEYQSKLQELKSYYDGEMKKMSLTQKAKGTTAKTNSAKTTGLPAKKISGKSLPVRAAEAVLTPPQETSTAAPTPESSDAAEIVNIDEGAI